MLVFSYVKKLSQLFINMLEIKPDTGLQIDLRRDRLRISSSEMIPLSVCCLATPRRRVHHSRATKPSRFVRRRRGDRARLQEWRFEPFHGAVGVSERPVVIQP